jgi:hypothetical protein
VPQFGGEELRNLGGGKVAAAGDLAQLTIVPYRRSTAAGAAG